MIRLEGLMVTDNDRLTALSEFPKLWYDYDLLAPPFLDATPEQFMVQRPDWIEISGNAALAALSLPVGWLSGGIVLIQDNPTLAQVAFTRQRSVDYLSIKDNPALESVNIGALDTVNTLEVVNNPEFDAAVFATVRTFESNMSSNAAAP